MVVMTLVWKGELSTLETKAYVSIKASFAFER